MGCFVASFELRTQRWALLERSEEIFANFVPESALCCSFLLDKEQTNAVHFRNYVVHSIKVSRGMPTQGGRGIIWILL